MKIIVYGLFFLLCACGGDIIDNAGVGNERNKLSSHTDISESSIINFSYEIYGKPRLGEIVTININTDTENYNKAIAMKYRINIIDDLIFADDQVKQLELNQLSDGTYPVQQINVIPQRVGRVYIVVSGEINKNGTVITKSTAVPIDVDQTIGS